MSATSNKVGVEEYVENFLAENAALRRKLQSKAEALLILSKELDQCRTERDQFKLMAEQLQDRYSSLKKKSLDMGLNSSLYADGLDNFSTGNTLLQVLTETKEKNKAMKIEIEDLRQKLRDAQGDIKVLRVRVNQQRSCSISGENHNFPSHQREELVQQLETMNNKCTQMEADLQSVLDEKEELVTERDAYKCKVHRLNHELNTLLKSDNKRIVDVDALVMENRYLQERLQQTEEEKDMINQALCKYKSMLEKKRNKGTVKLGTNNNSGMVMSHRQVQQLLEHGTSAQLPNTAATLADMKSLCLALLEALSDKSLALSHQKKANKILARRVSELEQRLDHVEGSCISVCPSQILLEGYTSSEVDRDTNRILAEDDYSDSEGEPVNSYPRGTHEKSHQNCNITEKKEEICISDDARKDSHQFQDVAPHFQSTSFNEILVKGESSKTEHLENSKHSQDRISETGKTNSNLSLHGTLPLQLQLLVQKALDDMKLESELQ